MRFGSPLVVAVFLLAPVCATGLEAPQIRHDPPGCVVSGRFPKLRARLEPASAGIRVFVRFREEGSLYWYLVQMEPEDEGLVARLPSPRRAPRRIEYALQAQGSGQTVAGSPVFTVDVIDSGVCPDGRPVMESETQAKITVGYVSGAPVLPPGFSAEGVTWVLQPSAPAPDAPLPPPSITATRPFGTALVRGERVRVTSVRDSAFSGRRLVGRMETYGSEGLVLLPEGGGPGIAIPRGAIAQLEVSLGHRSRTRAALVGGVVALALGTVVGYTGDRHGILSVGLATGVVAFPVGAAVGYLLPAGERWEAASLDAPRVRWLSPSTGAVAVAFSVRF